MAKVAKGRKRKLSGKKGKKRRGRPVVKEWPERIPDTPENIARAVLTTPPKKDNEWEYMKRHNQKQTEQADGTSEGSDGRE